MEKNVKGRSAKYFGTLIYRVFGFDVRRGTEEEVMRKSYKARKAV